MFSYMDLEKNVPQDKLGELSQTDRTYLSPEESHSPEPTKQVPKRWSPCSELACILCITIGLVLITGTFLVTTRELPTKSSLLMGDSEHLPVELVYTSPELHHYPGVNVTCPEVVTTSFLVQGDHVTLQLEHNEGVGPDVPVYVGSPGNPTQWEPSKTDNQPCFYQDISYNAAFTVIRDGDHLHLTGKLQTKKGTFMISPTLSPNRLRRSLDCVKADDHRIQKISDEAFMDAGQEHLRRSARATKTPYYIQAFVGTDYSTYQNWYDASKKTTDAEKKTDALSNMKYYFAHVMNEVDMRYTGINSADFSLTVKVTGWYFATLATESEWSYSNRQVITGKRTQAKAEDVLKSAETYVDNFKSTFTPADMILLFTGYDLYSLDVNGDKNLHILGKATVGGICGSKINVAINEDIRRFESTTTAAHEAAHLIGAIHDGTGSATSCLASDQFIMTPFLQDASKYYNSYIFSSCSVEQIKNHITDLNSQNTNCMKDVATVYNQAEWDALMADLPGQLTSADEQCVIIYGAGSVQCGIQKTVESMCQALKCYKPADDTCYEQTGHLAMPGTTCGDKKWCFEGNCVQNPNAPNANADCVYGDYKIAFQLSDNKKTCTEYLTERPARCYIEAVQEACCESCPKLITTIPDCLYGDRAGDCNQRIARDCYDANTASVCCQTCHNFKDATAPTGCEYGDKETACATLPLSGCVSNQEACCKRCQATTTTTTTTTTTKPTTTTPTTTTPTTTTKAGQTTTTTTPTTTTTATTTTTTTPTTTTTTPTTTTTTPTTTTTTPPTTTTTAAAGTGAWSDWSAYSACSATCGPSLKTRTRTCETQPCTGSAREQAFCQNTAACPEKADELQEGVVLTLNNTLEEATLNSNDLLKAVVAAANTYCETRVKQCCSQAGRTSSVDTQSGITLAAVLISNIADGYPKVEDSKVKTKVIVRFHSSLVASGCSSAKRKKRQVTHTPYPSASLSTAVTQSETTIEQASGLTITDVQQVGSTDTTPTLSSLEYVWIALAVLVVVFILIILLIMYCVNRRNKSEKSSRSDTYEEPYMSKKRPPSHQMPTHAGLPMKKPGRRDYRRYEEPRRDRRYEEKPHRGRRYDEKPYSNRRYDDMDRYDNITYGDYYRY